MIEQSRALKEVRPSEATRLERAKTIFDDYVQLRAGEKVLFVTDTNKASTDPVLIGVLQQELVRRNIQFTTFVADEHMSQQEVLKALMEANVIWQSWGMKDSDVDYYKIVQQVEERKQRLVFAAGINVKTLDPGGAFGQNLTTLERRLGKIESKVRDAVGIRVESVYGTDLSLALKPGERRWFKENGVLKPGTWGNLPAGEVFTTPDEEQINGVLVLPALTDDVARHQGVDEFVYVTVRNGRIGKVDGGQSAQKLRKYLERASKNERDPRSVLQCAEVSFGANEWARSTVAKPQSSWRALGISAMEAEKRLGTIHIAFGSTKHGEEGTEGHTEAKSHLDFVLPRHGLTVTAYYDDNDWQKQKNGTKLIDSGGVNLLE